MRIVFMGTPDFAVPSLCRLIEEGYEVVGVVTQPDRPKGRKQILTPSPVKEVALQHNIPIFQPERIRKQEAYSKVLGWEPDLIVTAAFGQILPKALLEVPRLGCINVHASLLPKYRGGAPIHYAVMNGEQETGVTIMYMVEELDAGDIISQAKIPIGLQDTAGSMFDKLAPLGADLLIETLPNLIAEKIKSIPQEQSKVSYSPTIKREDEQIRFQQSAQQIYNQIRGLNPWPVAFAKLDQQLIKIWWAEWRTEQRNELPGTIIGVSPAGIDIATGEGILILKEIQPAGKKKMNVVDFLRGSNWIKEGMRFEVIDE